MRPSSTRLAPSLRRKATPDNVLGIIHALSIPFPNSTHGYNSNINKKFLFNTVFNSTTHSDAPQVIYDLEANSVRAALDFIDNTFMVGMNVSAYNHFAGILEHAFEQEQGAIFYSIISHKWMFCAWLDTTFFDITYYVRLCASLISFGLPDIDRLPVENEDYVTTAEMHTMIFKGKVKQIDNQLPLDDDDDGVHIMRNVSVRDGATTVIDVNLDEHEDSYEKTCKFTVLSTSLSFCGTNFIFVCIKQV
ncbi:hypothetical protein FGB62_79g011 [Gracilaria domingensis]|nr:hypothetical protein FGB62_79g011 [Gracilaria domingensis]